MEYSKNSNIELLDSLIAKFENISQPLSDRCSIYRVPRFVRQLKEDAYTPRLVSIGPFHHGHKNLQAMEVHKIRYMHSLLRRSSSDPNLNRYIEAVMKRVDEARECYSQDETILGLEQGKLAEILLIDGCFILEVLFRFSSSDLENSRDPVFGNVSMINCLQRDLLLLENQIPFFVLESLFHLTDTPGYKLRELCVYFHLPLNLNTLNLNIVDERHGESRDVRHLLDLVRKYYLPLHPKTKPYRYINFESIHCATKLKDCGIKFRKGSPENLFDIKFNSRTGVLEIPLLLIQDATESLLRNMIAFEQCCKGTSHYLSSYVMLMDCLIDSPRDVELLEQKRIIANHLGSGEDVSQLFNNMFKEVVLDDFYFEALCQQVNEYCNRPWSRYRALLASAYGYGNPWRMLLVIGLSVLLMLTVLQTLFTVLSYYRF